MWSFSKFSVEYFHHHGEYIGVNVNILPCLYRKCVHCDFCTLSLHSRSGYIQDPHTLCPHPKRGAVIPTILSPSPFWYCRPSPPRTKRYPLDCNKWSPKTNNIFLKIKPYRTNAILKLIYINLTSLNFAEVSVILRENAIHVTFLFATRIR